MIEPTVRRWRFPEVSARGLLLGFACLHLFLAVLIFAVGRSSIAPSVVDQDGIIPSFAFDGYTYRAAAEEVLDAARTKGITAFITEPQSLHVKVTAVQMAVLGPLTGHGPLSAEPLNLACYLLILFFTYLLGREVGTEKAGLWALTIVGLWPSILLHTLQLLKDGTFIAAALAFILCLTTLLTREYGPRAAVVTAGVTSAAIWVLTQTRGQFVVMIAVIALLTAALLFLRKVSGGESSLKWNLASLAFIILVCVVAGIALRPRSITVEKIPNAAGPAKSASWPGENMPTALNYFPGSLEDTERGTVVQSLDHAALAVGTIRTRLGASYPEAGSTIDGDVDIRTLGDLIEFVPRAFAIGAWAPFPKSWIGAGKRISSAGKTLSGLETLIIYLFQVFAIIGIAGSSRRIPSVFLLLIAALGMTFLGIVVNNIGAMYRFRYTFWILIIVLAAQFISRFSARSSPAARRVKVRAAAATLLIGCLFASACAPKGSTEENRAHVTIVNYTGSSLDTIYLSPTAASDWQDDLLAGAMKDGDSIEVLAPLNEVSVWDLHVGGGDNRHAEWRQLRLHNGSRITLKLMREPGLIVVAADVE